MYSLKHLSLSKYSSARILQSLAERGGIFNCRITEAIASIFPCSTTIPVFSSIASGLPPVLYVTTGVPHARDSRLTVGYVSAYVGLIRTSDSL